MDIVKLWQDIADKYNQDNKCGFCWTFGAPLTNSGVDQTQATENNKCCAKLFLTDIGFESGFEEDFNKVSVNKFCDYYFNLWVVLPSSLGVNNHNEIPNHEISDSNWEKIYKPLFNCFGCDFDANFCADFGVNVLIKKWRLFQVVKYGDANYSGFKVQAIFRIYK